MGDGGETLAEYKMGRGYKFMGIVVEREYKGVYGNGGGGCSQRYVWVNCCGRMRRNKSLSNF